MGTSKDVSGTFESNHDVIILAGNSSRSGQILGVFWLTKAITAITSSEKCNQNFNVQRFLKVNITELDLSLISLFWFWVDISYGGGGVTLIKLPSLNHGHHYFL